MKVVVLSMVAGLAFAGGEKLATKYSSEQGLKYEISTSMSTEVTSMEVERDGEPVDAAGHSSGTEYESTEVHIDHVIELADGKPAKVRRTFEKLSGTASMTMGENSRDSAIESPFEGLTLELTRGKDGVEIEVVEGKAPEAEGSLEGHVLESFLDGLLPAEDVAVDMTWDLEKDAIVRALRLDLRKVLYPRPERAGGEGEGGGGGRRGGGGSRGGVTGLFDDADWKGTAKVVSLDKEVDGTSCTVIELELEASVARDLPAMRGPRGGAYGFEPLPENRMTAEVRLKGTFAFANQEKRPLRLALEGSLHTERNSEFSNDEHSMKSKTKSDGKFQYAVDVSVHKSEKTAK